MKYDIYLLGCLMERPHHGYEVKRKIADSFGLCNGMNNNTIYPLLARFEKEGIAHRWSEEVESAPKRYLYDLTEKGRLLFVRHLSSFDAEIFKERDTFFLYMMFFPYMTEEARRQILAFRKQYLAGTMSYLETRKVSSFTEEYNYRSDMREFNDVFMKAEIRLIKKLEKRASEPSIIDEKGNFINNALAWHQAHGRKIGVVA